MRKYVVDHRTNWLNRHQNIIDGLKNSPVTYKHICTDGIKPGRKIDCECNKSLDLPEEE